HVVDQDQAVGAHSLEAFLVVIAIVSLVGVDKREIETGRGRQRAQRLEPRTEPQRYLVRHPGPLPITAGDRGPFRIHVATQQTALGRKRARDTQRAVTGEGANLDRAAHPERSYQYPHEG